MPLIRTSVPNRIPKQFKYLSRPRTIPVCDSDSLVERLRWGADEISEDGIGLEELAGERQAGRTEPR
jgi:hypothetical protein